MRIFKYIFLLLETVCKTVYKILSRLLLYESHTRIIKFLFYLIGHIKKLFMFYDLFKSLKLLINRFLMK